MADSKLWPPQWTECYTAVEGAFTYVSRTHIIYYDESLDGGRDDQDSTALGSFKVAKAVLLAMT